MYSKVVGEKVVRSLRYKNQNNVEQKAARPEGRAAFHFPHFTLDYTYDTMLPKKQRLTKKEFDTFFQSGKRIHTPYFTLVYTPHTTFHGAVVVGKKVSKKAVTRNKIRRRVYAALYRLKQEQDIRGVYILLVKRPAEACAFHELVSELEQAVGRVGGSR